MVMTTSKCLYYKYNLIAQTRNKVCINIYIYLQLDKAVIRCDFLLIKLVTTTISYIVTLAVSSLRLIKY